MLSNLNSDVQEIQWILKEIVPHAPIAWKLHRDTRILRCLKRQYLSTEIVIFSGCSFVSKVLISTPIPLYTKSVLFASLWELHLFNPRIAEIAPSHAQAAIRYYCLLTHEDFSFSSVNSAMLCVILARGI